MGLELGTCLLRFLRRSSRLPTTDLTGGFQLVVPVTMGADTTRVVKYRYDESSSWYGDTVGSVLYSRIVRGEGEFTGLAAKRWDLALATVEGSRVTTRRSSLLRS